MKVHHIKEFILDLESSDRLTEFDRRFLFALSSTFLTLDVEDGLDTVQIEGILDIFAQRWVYVVDTELDYTFDPSGVNDTWIQLARDLAPDANITYLQVLIPQVTNTFDASLLNPLSDCSELRGFFLAEDGETLHRVRGLFQRVQLKQDFSIFRNPKSYVACPLTLREMLRLESKVGNLTFELYGVDYKNFWDYVQRAVMPKWRRHGECPQDALRPLLEVVESYFVEGEVEFRKKLLNWEAELQFSVIEDVNCLYGQVILVEGESFYLIDILLAALKGTTLDTGEQLTAIIRWLAVNNPSLISTSDNFGSLYSSLHIRPKLTVKELTILIATLDDSCSIKIRGKLAAIARQLKKSESIDASAIEAIKDVFQHRWTKFCGGEKDYTRQQRSTNLNWIRLAQILAGAGYIGSNYYRFLMPTITADIDPVTKELITEYPLSHYVLSEDARYLILLDNSALRYESTQTFYNCTTFLPQPFTRVEILRIARANKRFHKYLEQMVKDKEIEDSISLSSVLALKQLVEDSLYPEGLIYSYNESQLTLAERAYQRFFLHFLDKLSTDELRRLNGQRIFFHGKIMRFEEVLQQVQDNECIAVYGQYFAQLVLDYAPWLQFKKEIEAKVCIKNEMRANSRKKIISEYAEITNEEAARRLGVLFVSIMTRSFQNVMFSGYSERVLGYSNVLPLEAKNLLLPLLPSLEAGHWKNARHLYVTLIESIAKTSASDNSMMTNMYRYTDTQTWLNSVADQTLFKKRVWFDPGVLLDRLIPFIDKTAIPQIRLEAFFDEVLQLSFRSQNAVAKKLHINMKLTQLLKTLDREPREQILQLLSTEGEPVEQERYNKLCMKFISHRLASLCAEDSGTYQLRFFSKREACKVVYRETLGLLKFQFPKGSTQRQTLEIYESGLQTKLFPSCKDSALTTMEIYWEKITGRRLVPYVAEPQNNIVISVPGCRA